MPRIWLLLVVAGCVVDAPPPSLDGTSERVPDLRLGGAADAVVGGDFDGDGRGDLAVLSGGWLRLWSDALLADPAAPTAQTKAPRATALAALPTADGLHLVTGGAGLVRWRFDGALTELWSDDAAAGAALAVGDLDGDGVADLAASLPGGVARFLGPDLTPAAILRGTGEFGAAIAAGDVDGDGVDELFVGAPADATRGPDAGAAHLVSGERVLWSTYGQGPGARLGTAVVLADGDGDGLADRFVGAPGHHPEWVIPGGGALLGWYGPELDLPAGWSAQLNLTALRERVRGLGTTLAAADISGDGRADLLATDGGGVSLVWPQSPLGVTPWPSIWRAGEARVAALPDLDGDGAAEWAQYGEHGVELFRGTPMWLDADGDGFTSQLDCGASTAHSHPGAEERCDLVDSDCDGDLVDGARDTDLDGLPDCVDADAWNAFGWSTLGSGELGSALAMGDLDGDGTRDGVVLAPALDWLMPGEGAVYAFRNPSWKPSDAVFGGVDHAGMSGLAVGDVDGDGFADVVLASPTGIRLHAGGPDGLVPWAAWTAEPGAAHLSVGDINADGRVDIVAADPRGTRVFTDLAGDAVPLAGAVSALVADVDGDGFPDVVLAGSTTQIAFGPDLGDVLTVEAPSTLLAAIDIDSDGTSELALGGGGIAVWSVAGRSPRLLATLDTVPLSLAAGDLNADGLPELYAGLPDAVAVHVGVPGGVHPEPLIWPAPPGATGFGAALTAMDGVLAVGAPGHAVGGGVYRWDEQEDIDADGLDDAMEWALGLSPADPDLDDDGVLDGDEAVLGAIVDTDGDGLLDPLDSDSDGDGVPDGEDVCPKVADDGVDSDGDGYGDACECPVVDEDAVRALATVTDLAPGTGAADTSGGHYKRGRAMVVADFDLDGRPDQYVGNPGDTSLVLQNLTEPGGPPVFEVAQELMVGHFAWTAAAADYDNDGDYDLVVGGGGNECVDFDILWRNEFIETGELRFTDVTAEAGIAGPVGPDGPIAMATASVNWVDVDRDGDVDLFAGANWSVTCMPLGAEMARNTLWLNNGDGTFADVTESVGLHTTHGGTRHATFADFDGDGDDDLYESNMLTENVLWQNQLADTGELRFLNVTDYTEGAADLSRPIEAFASCAGDMDNDGWEDLVVFRREDADCALPFAPWDDDTGHAVFRNLAGAGFENVGMNSRLNDHPVDRQRRLGVMGCQLGDLDGDGFLDVFIGNGGPSGGQTNQLLLADTTWGEPIAFQDISLLIDVPAPDDPTVDAYPSYPYRTHGTAIVDADGDLVPELWIANGGPAINPDSVREPNRLFAFDWGHEARFLTVRPVGDGIAVPRDGIGTRLRLVTIGPAGGERSIYRTQTGGSCFSAQNGFEIPFGLGEAVAVDRLEVTWPDGSVRVYRSGLAAGERVIVEY
ncbi:MAG: hypothetical protein ACI8PZ_004306 [Myxococcota bacterium]|jgi:hypothetical protein